jgi:coproporphyrinogen III oxidase-like Fe-S oxidoreductase
MYKYTAGYLRSKQFEHYEISSYAAMPSSDPNRMQPSPYRSEHNQIYWGYNTQWFAVGLGATSFIADVTVARPRTMSDYLQWVDGFGDDKDVMISLKPGQDAVLEELESLVMKRLRTSDGLSLKYIEKRYGVVFVDAIWKGIQVGSDYNLVSIDDDQNTVRLTDPSGFLFSNYIMSNIFYELEAVDQKHCIVQKQNT